MDSLRRLVAFLAAVLTPLVSAGAATAQPVQRPPDAEVTAALQTYLTGRESEGFSGVVLVARGDTVLLERGYGFLEAGHTARVTPDSVFTTGSITKQFTAAAILKLEMQGKLSTGDRLSARLPGVPEDKRDITLHHLLTHTAGLPPASGDDLDPIARDSFVRLVLGRPLEGPIGRFKYSNVGYSLLAAVIERVSGQPYETYLAEQLFGPAGMRETGYARPAWPAARLARAVNDDGTDRGTFGETAMPNGTPGWHLLGNGGILSTARDMFRWHQALTGTAVLDEAEKAKLFRGWVDEGGGSFYGYGWSTEDTPFGRLITHNGGNRYFFADFLRYTDTGVIVYYTTNSRGPAMHRLARPLAQIAHTGRVLGDRSARTFTQVPAGSAGERLARVFLETVSADTATRRARVPQIFSAGLIERRGADALVGFFDRVKGDLGGAAPSAIEESRGPDGVLQAVRLRFSGPAGGLNLILLIAPGPEPTVDAVELEAGA